MSADPGTPSGGDLRADLAALERVAQAAAAEPTVEAFARRACEDVAGAAGARLVGLFGAADEGRARLLHLHGGDLAAAACAMEAAEGGEALRDLAVGGVVARGAEAWEAPVAETLRRLGVGITVSVAVAFRSRVVGALCVGYAGEAPPPQHRLDLLRAMAGQLGAALETHRLLGDLRGRVDELTRANEAARRRARDLAAVNALASRVFETAPGDARGLLDAASRELAAALNARAAVVMQLDPSGTRLEGVAGHGTPVPPAELAIPLARSELASRVLRTQVPACGLHVLEPAAGERGPPPLSLLLVPLTSRRAARGLVAVADRPDRVFDPADVALAEALAREAAVGLENAELYAEAHRRVAELSLLNEVGRAVAGSLDLDVVLSDGARAVRTLLGATHCHVFLLDATRAEVVFGATTIEGASPIHEFRQPLAGRSLPAVAARERRPVVVPDTLEVADPDVAEGREHGARALLAAPLLVRDEPVGVLVVSQHDRPRHFTPGEIERVTSVANQLAVAVASARLFAETRRRADELAALLEVGRSLVATLELDQVLDAGVKNLARIVQASDAYLLLADAQGRELTLRAAAGAHPELVGHRVPVNAGRGGASAWVFHHRTPLLVDDAAGGDARLNPELHRLSGARAYLGLPLVVRDRAIGVALIIDARAPRVFGPAEVERATAVANQLAVAAEHARLYEDLRRSYAELGRAQEQLVHRERLAALGELAAVVAHEVRNPLGVIFNSLGSLNRLLRPEGDARMLLDIVGEEAARLNRMVGDLLEFARPVTPAPTPEPLDRLLDEAVTAALPQARGAITVERHLPPGLPLVPVDARLLRQALVNLALNAVQAMPEGGTLSVAARVEEGAAVVEVADTGPGVPEDVRPRIFEPFFTTKATGTGLGLALVKRIVEGHRGKVEVLPRSGGGSVFAVRLPLAVPALDAGAPPVPGWTA